jgi:Tol biopolymer transport system component
MRLSIIRWAVTFGIITFASLTAKPAVAQTGVIAFREACDGLLYAMRGDSSGRIALPFPSLPLPTDRYSQPEVLDVTTSGPTTVLYRVAITRTVVVDGMNVLTLVSQGLFAVQVDDAGGVLTAHSPVPLSLPPILGVDPNNARDASFSPPGDRVALVGFGPGRLLMTAQVERDSNLKIIGLSGLVAVTDLLSIGTPGPGVPTNAVSGDIDYAPDGRSLVASVYRDLWLIQLREDNTFLNAERLTQTDDGIVEFRSTFSPDGGHIAFVSGETDQKTGGVRDTEIYSLDTATRAVVQVTRNQNSGTAADGRDNPMWTPDSAWIGFTAFTSGRVRRGTACDGLVNSDIFLIQADGSTKAIQLTNTNGTSTELFPKWGW